MPRRIRDINLTTRTARLRLPVRHDPYYRQIQIGLFVGYRRLAGRAGTWLKRHLVDGFSWNTTADRGIPSAMPAPGSSSSVPRLVH
jgi:hypothetical protein